MLSMQYNIPLPADYDMEIIRRRVTQKGHQTDGFPLLGMKAYLVAEKGRYGNYENRYAPFYLWLEEEGMNRFLLEGPFDNITGSFGRPAVHYWIVLHAWEQRKRTAPQVAAVRRRPIAYGADLKTLRQEEGQLFTAWNAKPETSACVVAYNPQSWEICRFIMSSDKGAVKAFARNELLYDVHHIS